MKKPLPLLGLILVIGCGSDEEAAKPGICEAAALVDALAGAQSGDTVLVGSCTVFGLFAVPDGVSVEGYGEDSILKAEGDEPGIQITTGSTPTRIFGLTIESTAPVAILARGTGALTLEQIHVSVTRGVGIGAEGLSAITLTDVTIVGPITPQNASAVPDTVTSRDSGTYGLVLSDVNNATLNNTITNAFALAGSLFVDSNVTWTGGEASGNLGLGLLVEGGSATIADLEINNTLQGFRLMPAFGAVFTASASVDSNNLKILNGESFGLLHHTGSGSHIDVEASNNRNAAVWLQGVQSLEITGQLSQNEFANLVAVDSQNLSVRDAQIDNAVKTVRVLDDTGSIEVGDGIQLVRSAESTTLQNVTLSSNQRVGVLIDLDGETVNTGIFNNVEVSVGSTEGFGAVVQGGSTSTGWDNGLTRVDIAPTTDANAAGTLRSVEAVGPCELPASSGVSEHGLSLLTGCD